MNTLRKEKSTFNSTIIGLLFGVIVPILFFINFYFRHASSVGFFEFLEQVYNMEKLVYISSISVFPNILVFMTFIKTYRSKSAKAVLYTTVTYVALIFALKLIS